MTLPKRLIQCVCLLTFDTQESEFAEELRKKGRKASHSCAHSRAMAQRAQGEGSFLILHNSSQRQHDDRCRRHQREE
jgi:hypothetical protein